jgi:hypothetical protein
MSTSNWWWRHSRTKTKAELFHAVLTPGRPDRPPLDPLAPIRTSDINLTSDREAREGYALYQRWTTAHPHLAYLLTSGDRTNAALPAIRDGVVAFLAKPFELTELSDTVQALLREHTRDVVPGGMLLISNSV